MSMLFIKDICHYFFLLLSLLLLFRYGELRHFHAIYATPAATITPTLCHHYYFFRLFISFFFLHYYLSPLLSLLRVAIFIAITPLFSHYHYYFISFTPHYFDYDIVYVNIAFEVERAITIRRHFSAFFHYAISPHCAITPHYLGHCFSSSFVTPPRLHHAPSFRPVSRRHEPHHDTRPPVNNIVCHYHFFTLLISSSRWESHTAR